MIPGLRADPAGGPIFQLLASCFPGGDQPMRKCPLLCTLLVVMLPVAAALADDGVTFHEIGGTSGLDYSHAFPARAATLASYFADKIVDVPTEYVPAPYKPYGVPGAA